MFNNRGCFHKTSSLVTVECCRRQKHELVKPVRDFWLNGFICGVLPVAVNLDTSADIEAFMAQKWNGSFLLSGFYLELSILFMPEPEKSAPSWRLQWGWGLISRNILQKIWEISYKTEKGDEKDTSINQKPVYNRREPSILLLKSQVFLRTFSCHFESAWISHLINERWNQWTQKVPCISFLHTAPRLHFLSRFESTERMRDEGNTKGVTD